MLIYWNDEISRNNSDKFIYISPVVISLSFSVLVLIWVIYKLLTTDTGKLGNDYSEYALRRVLRDEQPTKEEIMNAWWCCCCSKKKVTWCCKDSSLFVQL